MRAFLSLVVAAPAALALWALFLLAAAVWAVAVFLFGDEDAEAARARRAYLDFRGGDS